jgi:hypothetical protein
MGYRHLLATVVGVSLAVGCGGSPSSPSSTSGTSTLASQTAALAAMTQAMSQLAIAAPTTGLTPNGVTMPCPGGGSIVLTFTTASQQQTNVYRSTSRTEFQNCTTQTVTLNGDPYLETSAEHSFSTSGPGGDSVSTMTTTGGLRMSSGGVTGRAQFNCTMIASVHVVNGTPQVSVSSSGTITFEQPLGSTPVTRPCGPA